MADFLLKSRDNPKKALGVVAVVITLLVGVTVLFSTAMYMRNSKSNRIVPTRRIIKRRPRERKPWTVPTALLRFSNPADKFLASDPTDSPERCSGSPRPKPPPPSAPCLPPPPPGDRPRAAVPTISGALVSKASKVVKSSRRREANISSALVSELKMKLEQKINENNQGYY